MGRANLNISKFFFTSTTTASNYIPNERPRICINRNPPFQTQIYLVKVPLNMNLIRLKQFLKSLWSQVWKRGFQLMQILVLLGMYLDSMVCKSQEEFTFIQVGSGYTVANICVIKKREDNDKLTNWDRSTYKALYLKEEEIPEQWNIRTMVRVGRVDWIQWQCCRCYKFHPKILWQLWL